MKLDFLSDSLGGLSFEAIPYTPPAPRRGCAIYLPEGADPDTRSISYHDYLQQRDSALAGMAFVDGCVRFSGRGGRWVTPVTL